MARSSLIRLAAPTVAAALALSACGSGDSGSSGEGGEKELKVAALFSGSATDAVGFGGFSASVRTRVSIQRAIAGCGRMGVPS